jgi:hypothetical protein
MPAKQVVTVKKPYCKVCHDAGKDESIYTSHYVRSDPGPNGKIICPTLLAVKCSYCFKEGHTSSHCQILIKNKKQLAKDVAKKNYLNNEKEKSNYSTTTSKSSNKKNSFECLLEEVENKKKSLVKKIVKEEFPALSSKPTIMTKNDFTISYANMAKTAHEKEVKEEIMTEILSIIYKNEEPPTKPKIIVAKKEVKVNWADYSSSDDEDEEELMTSAEYYKEYLEEMPQNDAW